MARPAPFPLGNQGFDPEAHERALREGRTLGLMGIDAANASPSERFVARARRFLQDLFDGQGPDRFEGWLQTVFYPWVARHFPEE